MALTAWSLALGTYQGRIQPTNWIAPSGSYVYQLGHDLPGVFVKLAAGDYNQVSQESDLTGVNCVRVRAHLRGVALPTGLVWRFSAGIVGKPVLTTRDLTTAEVDRADIVIPTTQFAGLFEIFYRLELVGPDGNYDVELPGVYVDAVIADDSAVDPYLCNRLPEPGDAEVGADGSIAFDVEASQSTFAAQVFQVYVNGQLAYDISGFQPGWSGTIDATGDLFGERATLTPDVPFDPLSIVTVRVLAFTRDIDSPLTSGSLDSTYTFVIADTIAPVVVSAFALEEQIIRVTFDEPLASPGVPADYALSLVSGAPAVTPAVTAVTFETTSTVLLTLDVPHTPNAVYRVTVTDVEDRHGNVVTPPLNTATWIGYACAGVEGRDFDLYSMMLRSDRVADLKGELRDFIGCYQEVTNLLLCRIDRFPEILDPDRAPERYVDLMLKDLGNPFSFDLNAIEKRRLAQTLVEIYKSKGTDLGIVNAIRLFLNLEISIEIPWQTSGRLGQATIGGTLILGSGALSDLYTYVVVSPIVLTAEERKRVIAVVKYMQRAPCHFSLREPAPPPAIPDHMVLGLSRLGLNTILH